MPHYAVMPHYKDGTEAKIGDQVVGKLYNTLGVRAGTIVSITPGMDTCNAMVAYIEPVPIDDHSQMAWAELEFRWQPGSELTDKVPRMATWVARPIEHPSRTRPLFRVIRGEQHGSTGPFFALFECADYCAVAELEKVGP